MNKIYPFLNSFIGSILDYLTTFYALNYCEGLYETHLQYNIVYANLIFLFVNLILMVFLNEKKYDIIKLLYSSIIYLGFVNNIMVLANFGFYGWII